MKAPFNSTETESVESIVNRALTSNKTPVGVVRVDIDDFAKVALQTGGPPISDLVFESVADRIRQLLQTTDALVQVDDDELVIVRAPLGSPAEAESLGLQIVDSFERPFWIGPGEDNKAAEFDERYAQDYWLTASVGVATSQDGDNAASLLRHSSQALNTAKSLGRNQMVASEVQRDVA